jgi:hypothetical protein
VQVPTVLNESDLDAQQDLADNYGSSLQQEHVSAAPPAASSPLFPSDLRLLAYFSAVHPVPCLSGWDLGCCFGLLHFVNKLHLNCNR